MNKVIQFLKIYLISCMLMLPVILIGQFVGTMIIYYNYGYAPISFPKYDNLILYILLFGLYKAFNRHEIVRTISIQDEPSFRKSLNTVLSSLKMIILSEEENLLIAKDKYIIDMLLCNPSTLIIHIYNDKAVFKGSREDIRYVFANLKQRKEITSN
ncbi:hypothetical protein [Tepidibacter aestuarii]|uniref:hypothetical protein n=1 Tax=Tepidibacter aestuarii TaxID=2925782 RepID=UPI0020C15D1B|nr:hypothetical protein [Tepidibacter aestuarii]CAH2215317.1 protein of unknown function [Tepidibacter aestuarii]